MSDSKMSGRDRFSKHKPIINLISLLMSILPIKLRLKLFEMLRNTKGSKGILLRYCVVKSTAKNCGDNVSIHSGVYIFNLEGLSFGNNVSIHPMCYIDAIGEVNIGNNVSIAHGVSVLSSTHTFESNLVPIKYQPIIVSKTTISDDIWIGAKSTIIGGVLLEKGCIIGANSVVTKDVKSDLIVAGVPAKEIKRRIYESGVCT